MTLDHVVRFGLLPLLLTFGSVALFVNLRALLRETRADLDRRPKL